MRGKFLHNHLVAQLALQFRRLGAIVKQEHYFRQDCVQGFIDLLIHFQGRLIACEVELSDARVGRDIKKAKAVSAVLLLIVVPNNRVARAVRHELAIQKAPPNLTIICFTFGIVHQRLANCCSLMSPSNVLKTFIHMVGESRPHLLTAQPQIQKEHIYENSLA